MTNVVAEEHKDAIQVAKQLDKLIEVISVTDVTEQRHVIARVGPCQSGPRRR